MKSLSTEVRALLAALVETSSPVEILRIASAIAANEQVEAVSLVAALSTPAGAGAVASRLVNLDASGKPTAGEHVAVYDRRTGLTWSRGIIGRELNYDAAMKAASEFKLFGKACRAPTIEERISITDYARHSPALDTAHFAKESGWEWTSTKDAESPSGYAWSVGLGSGYAYRGNQSYRGNVRAVLAGQQLPIGV